MNRQSKEKITALYCRIANDNKNADRPASRAQEERLLQYAADHGLKNPELFCDWGFSGTTFDRPEFQRMLREIEAGRVSDLVVKDLSRLSRDYISGGVLIDEMLPMLGVTLHTTQEGIYHPETSLQLRQAILSMVKGGRA